MYYGLGSQIKLYKELWFLYNPSPHLVGSHLPYIQSYKSARTRTKDIAYLSLKNILIHRIPTLKYPSMQ